MRKRNSEKVLQKVKRRKLNNIKEITSNEKSITASAKLMKSNPQMENYIDTPGKGVKLIPGKEECIVRLKKFKKKRLSNMKVNPENEKDVVQLEKLLGLRGEWIAEHFTQLFSLMCNKFDIVAIYGHLVQNSILNSVDKCQSYENVLLASKCQGRLANVKKTNGTELVKKCLSSLIVNGKQLFDCFNVPSNLNEIDISLSASELKFSDIDSQKDHDVIFQVYCNRIIFLFLSIYNILTLNPNLQISIDIYLFMNVVIGFVSIKPGILCNRYSQFTGGIYFLYLQIWELIRKIYLLQSFGNFFYHYKYMIDIINESLLDIKDFVGQSLDVKHCFHVSLLDFVVQLVVAKVPFASCLFALSPVVIDNIQRIAMENFSSRNEELLLRYVKILCFLLRFYPTEETIKECCQIYCGKLQKLKHLLTSLKYRHSSCSLEFREACDIFLNLLKKCNLQYSIFSYDYFRIGSLTQLTKYDDVNEEPSAVATNVDMHEEQPVDQVIRYVHIENTKEDGEDAYVIEESSIMNRSESPEAIVTEVIQEQEQHKLVEVDNHHSRPISDSTDFDDLFKNFCPE